MTLREYVSALINEFPHEVYVIALVVLLAGGFIFIGFKGLIEGLRYSSILLFCEYTFLLFCATVLFRNVKNESICLTPFWSYERPDLINENIMNVVVFIPVGLLLGLSAPKVSWWKAMGFGALFSITIELMQFAFSCGYCEIDDFIHNTLGCAMGFALFKSISFIIESAMRKTKSKHPTPF